jgi:hypothetical protein
LKKPLRAEDVKKRIQSDRDEWDKKFNVLYEDAKQGKIDRERLAFSMDRLNMLDQELMRYRR